MADNNLHYISRKIHMTWVEFVVFYYGLNLGNLPISFRVVSLALEQSYAPSASEATLKKWVRVLCKSKSDKKSQENCEHIAWDILRQNSVCWDLWCELINLQWNRPQQPLGSIPQEISKLADVPIQGRISLCGDLKFLGKYPCIHMEINHV